MKHIKTFVGGLAIAAALAPASHAAAGADQDSDNGHSTPETAGNADDAPSNPQGQTAIAAARGSDRHLELLAAEIAGDAESGEGHVAANRGGDRHLEPADPAELAVANLAAAAFQDVEVAEAAGYVSTLDTLGCFENAEAGGMGVHYLNESLMDGTVDVTTPEALVYELDADGEIVGLVAHEYIVPVDAWTSEVPPNLYGVDLHQHPTLPLWVLHAWIWKDNPVGVFADWNPAVRMCPDGVPVFGEDLP